MSEDDGGQGHVVPRRPRALSLAGRGVIVAEAQGRGVPGSLSSPSPRRRPSSLGERRVELAQGGEGAVADSEVLVTGELPEQLDGGEGTEPAEERRGRPAGRRVRVQGAPGGELVAEYGHARRQLEHPLALAVDRHHLEHHVASAGSGNRSPAPGRPRRTASSSGIGRGPRRRGWRVMAAHARTRRAPRSACRSDVPPPRASASHGSARAPASRRVVRSPSGGTMVYPRVAGSRLTVWRS